MLYSSFFIRHGDVLAVLEEGKKNMHIVPICKMKKNWVEGLRLLFVRDHLTLFLPKAKLKAENMLEVAGGGKAREIPFFSFLFWDLYCLQNVINRGRV